MTETGVCLDTSVVLRLLVREPVEQHRCASAFLREQLAAARPVFVDDLVLAETYFALQSFYKLPKKDALEVLLLFVRHSGVTVGAVAAEVLARQDLATAKPGFVDLLIHGTALAAGRRLVTFEQAARRLPHTLLLDPA